MKCPMCFHRLPPTPVRMLCTGTCPVTLDERASAVRGYRVMTTRVFGVAPSAAGPGSVAFACPRCSTPSTNEACPYCSYPIPTNWRNASVTCVAMAGARATGKSLMLAVAKEQLQLLTERYHNSALRGVGSTEGFFRVHYTEPLFKQRRILLATATILDDDSVTRQPSIFTYKERLPGGQQRQRFLVVRDVAGEDLEDMNPADQKLTFFARADAVLALLDPLSVPQVRDMLADLIPAATRLGGDGITVIRQVLDLMTAHMPGARTSIPIGVVLSKVDVLQRLREVQGTRWGSIMNRPGSALQRDPSLMTAGFNQLDGDLLHEELIGLLELMNASSLVATLNEVADRFRLFAVSALGESPEGDIVSAGGIAPFRVLDPFKWAMQFAS